MKPIGGLVRYGEPSGDHAAADSADEAVIVYD
jgi:hypothetical protein